MSTTLAPEELEGFRRELTGYSYRMLASGFEAEDAVQDTFLRAWRFSDQFEGRASRRSWLYRIATNVCTDMHRSAQRRARPMDVDSDNADLLARCLDAFERYDIESFVTLLREDAVQCMPPRTLSALSTRCTVRSIRLSPGAAANRGATRPR